jgi:hypothetical protein
VLRLQPSIRAAMAEFELMRVYDAVAEGTDTAVLKCDTTSILTLKRPTDALFQSQLALVQSYSDLRSERAGEILSQIVPQTAAWSAIAGLQPERHRYTFELLGVGLRFVHQIEMRMKCLLECPRPMEFSPTIQPMILTPGHSTYPSGHATESYFIAELLPMLAKGSAENLEPEVSDRRSLRAQLRRLAYRIAENRVVAGVHYPLDSLAGQLLGTALAREFAFSCGLKGAAVKGGRFDPTQGGRPAADYEPVLDKVIDDSLGMKLEPREVDPPTDRREVLKVLWSEARKEWLW